MPIDPSTVKWDAPDPATIKWDVPPSTGGIPGPRTGRTWGSYVEGALEVPVTLATGAIGGVVGTPIGIAKQALFGKEKFGTPAAVREAEQEASSIAQAMTYQPRTEFGQEAVGAIGKAIQESGAAGVPPNLLTPLGVLGKPAGMQLAGEVSTIAQDAARARAAGRSIEAYKKGPQIDAALEAQRLGLALNPVDVEPSVGTKLSAGMAGPRGAKKVQETNIPQVQKIAKQDMGLAPQDQLNGPAAFEKSRNRPEIAGPYNEIRRISKLSANEDTIKALDDLRLDQSLIGATSDVAERAATLIDDAIEKAQAGLSGDTFLKSISTLRKRADKTYRSAAATTADKEIADVQLSIANRLEEMIDSNISDTDLLARFRTARQEMAKTYDYQKATDYNTGLVDPIKIAKRTAQDSKLTGDIAAIGQVAGNFPSAFTATIEKPWQQVVSRIGRSTPGGIAGGIAGSQMYGLTGGIIGSTIGALANDVAGGLMAKRIASPGYQAALKVPDYRLAANQLAAAAAPTPNVPAIFDPRNALVEDMPYFPDWVPGQRERPLDIRVEIPQAPNNLLPPPTAPQQTWAYQQARAAEEAAVAQQAAAEAASRRPAGRGIAYELDPVTGRFREVSQGIKGATPDVLQSTGNELESAARKVTEGRLFDLTATEKIAWDRTKIDLAEIAPGFAKLTDKEITAKMLDRQWVADTIQKARDKAAAFEQIAQRAKDAAAKREAAIKREQMLDLADSMEEQLRGGRPVSSGGSQGRKTREFQQNMLINRENQNALAR